MATHQARKEEHGTCDTYEELEFEDTYITPARHSASTRGGSRRAKPRIRTMLLVIVLLVTLADLALNVSELFEDKEMATKQMSTVCGQDDLDECQVSLSTIGGSPFNDSATYREHGPITAVQFKVDTSTEILFDVRARYGTEFAPWRATHSRTPPLFVLVQLVELEANETITAMAMYAGKSIGDWTGITALSMTTSTGRTHGPYGTSTNGTMTTATWTELLYFSSRTGSVVDALTAHARGCKSHMHMYQGFFVQAKYA